METGAKIGLAVGGLAIVIIGGVLIYNSTKTKVTGGGSNPGGNTNNDPPPNNNTGIQFDLNTIKNVLGAAVAATKEKFPLRVGMYGPNIKAMQTSLRNNFAQLDVKSDGIFGVKTFKALQNTKYATVLGNTISQEDFHNIIAGVKKGDALGFGNADGDKQQGDKGDFWRNTNISGNYPVL